MEHHIANVEIEFHFADGENGTQLLRKYLEAMLATMRNDGLEHPHYHLLKRRNFNDKQETWDAL